MDLYTQLLCFYKIFIDVSKSFEQEGLDEVFTDKKSDEKTYEIKEIKKPLVQYCSSSEDKDNIQKPEAAQTKQLHDNFVFAAKALEVNTLT